MHELRPFLPCALSAAVTVGALCLVRADAQSVTSEWSTVTCIDTRSSAVRFAKTSWPIAYAPEFSSGGGADHVVLRSVRYADTPDAVTNDVSTFSAGETGNYTFSFSAGDERCLRLLHSAYDAGGAQVGETLAADIAFGVTGTCQGNVVIDTRVDSLRLVAEAGGMAPLSYSTDWVTNGVPASVKLSCVCERSRHGHVVESSTNILLTVDAPAMGDCLYATQIGNGGLYTLTCSFFDVHGALLCDPFTASYYFKERWGMLLIYK